MHIETRLCEMRTNVFGILRVGWLYHNSLYLQPQKVDIDLVIEMIKHGGSRYKIEKYGNYVSLALYVPCCCATMKRWYMQFKHELVGVKLMQKCKYFFEQ